MNLTKNIEVYSYWVLATYKFKVENSPILAILEAVNEQGGAISPKQLCDNLLYPLSVQACKNLLVRLKNMDYLEEQETNYDYPDWEYDEEEYNEDMFELSELGRNAVARKVFYEDRKGVLKIYAAEKNDFMQQNIIKIQQLGKDFKDYENNASETTNPPKNLIKLLDKTKVVSLNNGDFILEEFEKKCIIAPEQKKVLTLCVEKERTTAKILDYEQHYSEWSIDLVQDEILDKKYGVNFIQEKQVVKVDFDKTKIELTRSQSIAHPQIADTTFNPTKLKINVSPMNLEDAKKWYFYLIKSSIKKYFMSEEEFSNFSNLLAEKFILFRKYLKNKFSRQDLIDEFKDSTDFYFRAKLETINYLNY